MTKEFAEQDAFMRRALELARQNVEDGGWPFSAVIVQDGEIISEGVNGVDRNYDPSDHAEMVAIRNATQKLKSTDLSGATMYVVGVPCPMCATCAILAKLDTIVYAVSVEAKDEALSSLPLTDGLYNLVSDGYGRKAITYKHLKEHESEGVSVFSNWNSDRG
ncbi:MAG: nucleoside deaminase [Pseudomonadota bacterium]